MSLPTLLMKDFNVSILQKAINLVVRIGRSDYIFFNESEKLPA
ncbi:MAG: Putative transposase [Candidatus Midichloria mitochondrii]|uniref:Putative transposase n=1 Tax=Midichloria mitochondrii (strain IricVA) TaxID=696127 RepID=F7XVV1_MIDMI|nr:putative transposase [Candidatus Midichloria mitochondrii IricVA]